MIAIVGTVGLPACYGGFETLVENLINENYKNEEITVYCSSYNYESKVSRYKGARLVYLPFKANGPQSVIYDVASLIHALFTRPNAILILGVSGCFFLPFFRIFSSAKIVTNIDGLEWKRDKWGKWARRFLKFSEKQAVKYSDIIVSDNQAIADYVAEEYDVVSSVIAYGGDHAVSNIINNSNGGYALSLCRIEPENNVEMILESFSKTEKHLKFIGNWEASDFGKKMKAQYSKFNNIEIIDPIYDVSRLAEIRSACSFYVHGHSAGGTNPSLVEMMHFGKPIVCFDCSYNRASTEDIATYFSCANSLIYIINNENEINNGSYMLEIAQLKYTWKAVGKQYFETIK